MVGMPGESLETAKASGKLLGEIAAKLRVRLLNYLVIQIFFMQYLW